MIRMHTGVEVKEVKQYRLSGFKGVDFSSSPLKVSETRATRSENMIYEGNIRKRNGWIESAKLVGKINGMYPYFDGVDGYGIPVQKYLVYAAELFYSVQFINYSFGYLSTGISLTNIDTNLLTDTPVQFYEQNSRIFIVGCGDFLVFHKPGASWVLERVFNNPITYIPTTSISLDTADTLTETVESYPTFADFPATGSATTRYEDLSTLLTYDWVTTEYLVSSFVKPRVQATLERPNLLTTSRKNTGRTKLSTDTDPTIHSFTMDGVIATNSAVTVVVTTLDAGVLTDHTITNSGVDKTLLYEGATAVGHITFATGVILIDDVVGAGSYCRTGNEDNVVFTFTVAQPTGFTYANITSCTFGTLFGVDGITSQLFVSGNATYPNKDWFSYPLDFTYFQDDYYRTVGNSAITGYARIGDGTLMIFKAKSSGEAAVFVRTGTYTENEDTFESDTTYIEKAGYQGSYLACRRSIENLAGDTVYLTSTGLKGIVLGENVTTDERYARERSRYVDKQLIEHTLSNAVGIVHGNKYYLAIEGVCYVADARFKSQERNDMDDTFNYEWFYWTNIGTLTNPLTCWYEDETDLYFGTNDGRICKFDDEFTDRTTTLISSGDLSIQTAHDHVAYNSSLTFTEGDRFVFSQSNIYHVLFNPYDLTYSDSKFRVKVNQCLSTAVTVATNRITLSSHGYGANDTYLDIYYHATTGTEIGGLTLGTKYRVKVIDSNTIEFTDGTSSTDITSQGTGTHEFLSATAMNLLWMEEDYLVRVVGTDDEDEKFDLYLYDIDLGDMSFKLKDGTDADVTMTDMSDASTIIVMRNISGVSLYVGSVDAVNHDLKLKMHPDSEDMYFAYYDFTRSPYYDDAQTKSTDGMVTSAEDIAATWYTPVFDLGTNVYAKTLLSITLSAEPVEKGQILFGYETRRTIGADSSNGLTTFSFDDVDFDDFAFDTEFATSCTRKVKVRNFNFIMFRFVSDNAFACEINDFTIRYNVSRMNKGVR